MPKALADTGRGPWVLRALDTLAPCDLRIVVIGAQADRVASLLPAEVAVVVNPDHPTGMASSLRIGLQSVPAEVDAVVVTLVDLPDLTAAVTGRVLAAAGRQPRTALARAVFGGRPGHPVLIGADHLAGVLQALARGGPDSGAGRYLGVNAATEIECGDLAGGTDQDTSDDAADGRIPGPVDRPGPASADPSAGTV